MDIRMHKFSDKVPEPTLRRLPWYLSNVKLMKEQGETYVSSTQISKQINVDASQIAKDLSYVNISGRTRVGYEIDALIEVLERFLGFTKMHKAFLFGLPLFCTYFFVILSHFYFSSFTLVYKLLICLFLFCYIV